MKLRLGDEVSWGSGNRCGLSCVLVRGCNMLDIVIDLSNLLLITSPGKEDALGNTDDDVNNSSV